MFPLHQSFLFSIKEKRIIKKPVKIYKAHNQHSVVVARVAVFSSSPWRRESWFTLEAVGLEEHGTLVPSPRETHGTPRLGALVSGGRGGRNVHH